ncbi:hypothetical protein BDV25DRAFT_138568 [Aspergillus avenaceus]|uniref:Uncharacterized protein n=1 Tax=Aspergillus avenaceus TaxID=36643 RepID=A0A5N6TZF0_ASPAV|nr:hypothetical protein BDV25DRAFT_138568 [Aspergillus avenaceus]
MCSIRTVLEAAATLSSLTKSDTPDLIPHRHELECAVSNLQELLQSSSSIPTPLSGSSTTSNTYIFNQASAISPQVRESVSVAQSTASATRDNQRESKKSSNSVQKLLERLDKLEGEIRNYFQQPIKTAVSTDTEWELEDPRIKDIDRIEKDRSPEARFRAGLSILSLADDYTEWERREHETTKIHIHLSKDLNCKREGRNSFNQYVENRFKNRRKVQRYIGYGIKLRVFEILYMSRVEVAEVPHLEANEQFGILGVLFFIPYEFRCLKYNELPYLAIVLLSSKWREHAQLWNHWMNDCFEHPKALRLFDKRDDPDTDPPTDVNGTRKQSEIATEFQPTGHGSPSERTHLVLPPVSTLIDRDSSLAKANGDRHLTAHTRIVGPPVINTQQIPNCNELTLTSNHSSRKRQRTVNIPEANKRRRVFHQGDVSALCTVASDEHVEEDVGFGRHSHNGVDERLASRMETKQVDTIQREGQDLGESSTEPMSTLPGLNDGTSALYEPWEFANPSDIEQVITAAQSCPMYDGALTQYESWVFDHPIDLEQVAPVAASDNLSQLREPQLQNPVEGHPIPEEWSASDDEVVLRSWVETAGNVNKCLFDFQIP